jgi:hypothetical protein
MGFEITIILEWQWQILGNSHCTAQTIGGKFAL